MPDITDLLGSQPKFPPIPPQNQWDFFTKNCPAEERFTRLKYECRRRAYYEDPSFADTLPTDWQTKYPQWPGTPYLNIPDAIRRQAHPELTPAGLQKIMADQIAARSIPEEAYEVFRQCAANDEPLVYEQIDEAYVVLRIRRGMPFTDLNKHWEAYAREYHEPKALTKRPEGAASNPRKFEAELNAITAYILLQTLTPAEATAVTVGLRKAKRGLYNGDKEWRNAAERGEFLIKKTKEDLLDDILLIEAFDRTFGVKGSTQKG
jgi:hypothetical protein